MIPSFELEPYTAESPFDALPSVCSDFPFTDQQAVVLVAEDQNLHYPSVEKINLGKDLGEVDSPRDDNDKSFTADKEKDSTSQTEEEDKEVPSETKELSPMRKSEIIKILDGRCLALKQEQGNLSTNSLMTRKVLKLLIALFETQIKVEQGKNYKFGPGRYRKNRKLPCQDLKQLIKVYYRNGFRDLIRNNTCFSRPDMVVTGFFRIIKKLPLVLVRKCGSGTQYKNAALNKYLAAYAEAYTSFHFATMTKNKFFSADDLISELAEFIMIYFPRGRYAKVTKALARESHSGLKSRIKQVLAHADREKTTKRSIKEWCKHSTVLEGFMEMAIEVLEEAEFAKSQKATRLLNLAKEFLNRNA